MKKRVLVTDTAPLYPPRWGGPKRIWNLYSSFPPDLFDITYVGVGNNLGEGQKYRLNRISDNFKEVLCSLPSHYYLWRILEQRIVKNKHLDLFVYLCMHTDSQFKYILSADNTDIIIFSHPWSSLCVQKADSQFFIYDAHNCEYLLMDRILGRHILKKVILNKVKKIEGDACKKSNLILVCSEKEKNDFIKLYNVKQDKIIIVPNGANPKMQDSANKKLCRNKLSISLSDKIIFFVGAYYKPNIDSARFIIEKLSAELSEFVFLISGSVSHFFKPNVMPKNVRLLEEIDDADLDAAFRSADIAINPMFDGSGINIKMLDYMSYGLPIVTTQVGARGIETFCKQPMAISSVDKFSENIKIIDEDVKLYKRMSEDGRSLITDYYNWKLISKQLQEDIIKRSGQ